MDFLNLTRRRSQLELLQTVADGRQQARVVRPQAGGGTPIHTRFVALANGGVVLAWPSDGSADRVVEDEPVEMLFEHAGETFSARARSIGRVLWDAVRSAQREAWQLTLPLNVQREQQRAHYRVSLDGSHTLPVRFTSTVDRAGSCEARMTNISAGGLGAVVAPRDAAKVRRGELYWIDLTLPGDGGRIDFVLRVVHDHQIDESHSKIVGCQFCPGEDADRHAACLIRVEQFVARREQAQLSHAIAIATGGA